ncbi:hypothetical protein AB1Y20_018161 [Prymnesium parvum]|uniref:Uncharacterized protein n=1 Tax=Prymnesium parvum TaxID=97485 RepID=A0AB34JRH9_PRYPA
MAQKAQNLWDEIHEKNRLDLSDQRLSDEEIGQLLKGIHMISRTSGHQTERMKPLPLTELDFSGNNLTRAGIGEVVQFARTQGCDATLVDLSDNQLCDTAAVDELTRLVKNYSAFAANNFISELLLNGNNIGKTGATKLIQYAHWERDRFKTAENPPPRLKLNLSDNCIDRPSELADELKSKRIKLTCVADDDDKESTVYLPDFMDQRDPPREKPISTSRYNGNRGPVGRPSRPPPPRQIRRDRSHSFERRDRGRDRGGYRGRERSRSRDRDRDRGRREREPSRERYRGRERSRSRDRRDDRAESGRREERPARRARSESRSEEEKKSRTDRYKDESESERDD